MRPGFAILCLLVITSVAACGGDSDPDLPPAAAAGREVARSEGCSACHGANGEGNIGPAWEGLLGTQVELDDGTVVTADEAYLRRSITDPAAEVMAGFTIAMPENDLTAEEIDQVIAFIEALAD